MGIKPMKFVQPVHETPMFVGYVVARQIARNQDLETTEE